MTVMLMFSPWPWWVCHFCVWWTKTNPFMGTVDGVHYFLLIKNLSSVTAMRINYYLVEPVSGCVIMYIFFCRSHLPLTAFAFWIATRLVVMNFMRNVIVHCASTMKYGLCAHFCGRFLFVLGDAISENQQTTILFIHQQWWNSKPKKRRWSKSEILLNYSGFFEWACAIFQKAYHSWLNVVAKQRAMKIMRNLTPVYFSVRRSFRKHENSMHGN